MTVGIVGMAFKPATGDTRDSLAYKLRRILRFRAREVVCSDDRVEADPSLLPLDVVVNRADVLVIGTPHPEYRNLSTHKPIVDISNLLGRGSLL